jgi:hypothetical protein
MENYILITLVFIGAGTVICWILRLLKLLFEKQLNRMFPTFSDKDYNEMFKP